MTNSPSSFTSFLLSTLPWQQIFDIFAAFVIPALIGVWRSHVGRNKILSAALEAVITGVENSTKALGPDGRQIKAAIKDQSILAGVSKQLDDAVQSVTKNQSQS